MEEETGKWVPCAKVKDTKANVTGLKKGQKYQFRVKGNFLQIKNGELNFV